MNWRTAKRLFILLIGSTVILVGIAMIVLPGPAFVVIPAGLAILATEFVWARRMLDKLKARVRMGPRQGAGQPVEAAVPPADAQRISESTSSPP